MSQQSDKKHPEVPDGKSRFLITRQMKPNEKGFVGYETIWEPFQKEAEYQTPKRP
ncbi:hypothetical protein [Thioalkalivibrio sp. AKL19]|uniref:hypothetical protein n=1 Tax=Thioalkalivibrio sp. AKL19 TaxID=1266914 RepID=UPI00040F059D|nr:hypothetical protein [Thioalkalivibrio sp. AKL19]